MAKTRAQRKAERRARQARESREGGPSDGAQARAQHDTQVPESGEVAEVEAVLETGELRPPSSAAPCTNTSGAPSPTRS